MQKDTSLTSKIQDEIPSIIGHELHINGNVNTSGELHVDGFIEGDVKADKILIGVNGRIKGSIVVHILQSYGIIEGTIKANTVFLANNARVIGDIYHESLAIEPGASIEGMCKNIQKDL